MFWKSMFCSLGIAARGIKVLMALEICYSFTNWMWFAMLQVALAAWKKSRMTWLQKPPVSSLTAQQDSDLRSTWAHVSWNGCLNTISFYAVTIFNWIFVLSKNQIYRRSALVVELETSCYFSNSDVSKLLFVRNICFICLQLSIFCWWSIELPKSMKETYQR